MWTEIFATIGGFALFFGLIFVLHKIRNFVKRFLKTAEIIGDRHEDECVEVWEWVLKVFDEFWFEFKKAKG